MRSGHGKTKSRREHTVVVVWAMPIMGRPVSQGSHGRRSDREWSVPGVVWAVVGEARGTMRGAMPDCRVCAQVVFRGTRLRVVDIRLQDCATKSDLGSSC